MGKYISREDSHYCSTLIITDADWGYMETDEHHSYSPKDYLIFDPPYFHKDKQGIITDRYTLLRLEPAWILPYPISWLNNYVLAIEYDCNTFSKISANFCVFDTMRYEDTIWNESVTSGVGNWFRFHCNWNGQEKIVWELLTLEKQWIEVPDLDDTWTVKIQEGAWKTADRIKRYFNDEWKRKQTGEFTSCQIYREEVRKKYPLGDHGLVHAKHGRGKLNGSL